MGLAQEGCNIIVHGRNIENTKKTISSLKKTPVQTMAVSGELGKPEEEGAFLNKIVEAIGHVDILYNNAAVMSH
jgi:NADP-dependent 3-hydroxy acid dehydrogenase YdfG